MTGTGVSVVIPAYEALETLRRTVACAVAECRDAGGPWEVLVVDNESRPETTLALRAGFPDEWRLRIVRRTGLNGRSFQPGAARNVGVELSRFACLVFLDADCIPSRGLVRRYRDEALADPGTVLIGHRRYVDAAHLDAERIAADRSSLDEAPPVYAASNYGLAEDRRLGELAELDRHRYPWDLMYSCNFALHRDCLGTHRFDPVFDGRWGYEDIELGYRLHAAGRRFRYLSECFAYHQEGGSVSETERQAGREHNFALAARLIPDFAAVRAASSRAGALPERVSAGPRG